MTTQSTTNEVNVNDIAYIKGLLYALINRTAKLEGKKKDISAKLDDVDAKQNSPSSTNTGSQNDAPEEGGSGTDNECYTRATFNCNTQLGQWEKGTFTLACIEDGSNDGWVHNGNTVTYTSTDGSSDDCASHGLDTDCALKLYGVFQIFQAPDSMLEYVKENYPCEIDEESSDDSCNYKYTAYCLPDGSGWSITDKTTTEDDPHGWIYNDGYAIKIAKGSKSPDTGECDNYQSDESLIGELSSCESRYRTVRITATDTLYSPSVSLNVKISPENNDKSFTDESGCVALFINGGGYTEYGYNMTLYTHLTYGDRLQIQVSNSYRTVCEPGTVTSCQYAGGFYLNSINNIEDLPYHMETTAFSGNCSPWGANIVVDVY